MKASAKVRQFARERERITAFMTEVSTAAKPFESRWSLHALKRVDPELHVRFVRQRALYEESLVTGEMVDVEEHAGGMVRGWHAVTRRMEQAGVEDDAYQIGRCHNTGTVVAIGDNRHTIDRVREVHGQRVVWLTPDEVATLFAGLESVKTVAAIKQRFPGAEIVDLYPDEPAKDEP